MTLLIFIVKAVASIILFVFLVAGILKANPRAHSPNNRHSAEYLAGFIIFIGSLIGFYCFWIA
jgi:hypothetical protein